MTIPKIIHIVWIGDESRCPWVPVNSWKKLNPEWEFRLWGNKDWAEKPWRNAYHMKQMARQELCGVADMMRWEIIAEMGGLAVDADSECVRPLDSWLTEWEAFACWENELVRPGLIAINAMASVPANPFFRNVVEDIAAERTMEGQKAWKITGPMRVTQSYHKYRYANLTILPSHTFIPNHFSGQVYSGPGPVYARQFWESTTTHMHAQDNDAHG